MSRLQAVQEYRFQKCIGFHARPRIDACCRSRGYHAIVGSSPMTVDSNREKPLRLALIGMSGAGKTFWTKKLAAAECPSVSCDDRIEQKLAPRLAAGGYAGINGVAAWMGWPDSSAYTDRESEYLAAEIHTMEETLTELEKQPEQSPLP